MKHKTKKKRGQAALTAVMFLLFILLSIIGTVSHLALKESKGAEYNFRSKVAFFSAESGVEDAVYRLKRGKNLSNSFTISLDGSMSSTTVTNILGGKEVKSRAEFSNSFRTIRSIITSGEGEEFFYGAQVGVGGIVMNNNATINGNIHSGGPVTGSNGAKITGSVVALGTITDMTIGSSTAGSAHAPSFINTVVHGSSCPNQYCVVESPVPENFPISEEQINGWKNDAFSGGEIIGNCGDNGVSGCNISTNETLFLGPKKISGDLVLTKKQTLILNGTLHFTGNVDINSTSGATIKCDSSFGAQSCILIADGWIHIENNATFAGSGSVGSYVLALTNLSGCNGGDQQSFCTHHNGAIDLHNKATGAIFYTANSMAHLHNGVKVTQLTANKLELENNATIDYESGLVNINFVSGPSGGWSVSEWKEVIQ